MPVNPYLNFAGNCREAVDYYCDVFQTEKPRIMTFGEMPPNPDSAYPLPDSAKDMIMHAQLCIHGTDIMFSDVFPGSELNVGNNVSLTVVTKDRDEILNAFNKLKDGATVHMDLQETFWSKLYANLRDKYGVEWQFSLDSGETFG